MIQAIIALLRIVNILLNKTYIEKGRKQEVMEQLLLIHKRLGVTKDIVRKIEDMSDDEVDDALRG